MTTRILLEWAVPSVVGFVFGYLTCLLVSRAVQDEDAPMPERRRRSQLARTMFGVLLIVMASVTFIQSYQATDCARDAIEAVSDAQGVATRAQIELLEASTDDDPTNNRDAALAFLDAARDLERARAENPLRCR